MEMGAPLAFLVVEDHAFQAKALVRRLRTHGSAEIAPTLADAHLALERTVFDALVVDVALPDGSGFDLLAQVRARDAAVPVLVLSGHVDRERLRLAHAHRAEYLVKPLGRSELARFVAIVRSRAELHAAGLQRVADRWARRHALTSAEADVLVRASNGMPRGHLAAARGVTPNTAKTQIRTLLAKTGDASLDGAAARLLREVLAELATRRPSS